jgi:hypothetical protein
MVWLLGRIQTNTPSDYPFVRSLQDQFRLTRWSDWGRPPKTAEPVTKPVAAGRTPVAEMDRMDAAAFFTRLCQMMELNPPAPADAPLIGKLAKIGIAPGRQFDFARLPLPTRQALESGVAEAKKALTQPLPGLKKTNGWNVHYSLGRYGVDYLLRAHVARMGLGANLPEDALYPNSFTDAEGRPLEGSRRYVVHFDKNLLPPVNAFWSMTIYDSRGFFTENAIGRYAIGDRDLLQYNSDGSLDIYIQHVGPGVDKESNWLPVPNGQFNVFLRLYWPKPQVLDGTWEPPPIHAVD